MSCASCVDGVKRALDALGSSVRDYRVDLDAKSVVVTSGLPSHELLLALRNTGLRVALRGLGGADACMVEVKNLGAAVCIMNAGGVLPSAAGVCGVVRFVQVSEGECVVEGTVDGLAPGLHGLHVHEFGDLSDGCLSAGDHYNPTNEVHGDRLSERRHAGDLGNVRADATGRASFRFSDRLIKVWDIIGRSLVVHAGEDDLGLGGHPNSAVNGNSGPRVACGVIARSAGVLQNTKQVCACDGRVLWDDRPLGEALPKL